MKQLQIPDIDLNQVVSKCKSIEDLVGKNGLMQQLFSNIIQQFLEAEMEELLGREKYERDNSEEKNYRNGYIKKNIRTSFGEVELDAPRDRNEEFESKVVKKYETVYNKLDKKVIGLYSIVVSVDDIQAKIHELYEVGISPSKISKITDKVIESAVAWQNRPLEAVYPIVCMDGLKGLPEAIRAVYPNANIQNCIIHQIRNSIKYIASKDSKAFIKDLKSVYQATSEEMSVNALQSLEATWGDKYSIVIQSWNSNWENLSTYFDFPPEIRRIIYTTNALEGFNNGINTNVKTPLK